jgi:hypothetical protein
MGSADHTYPAFLAASNSWRSVRFFPTPGYLNETPSTRLSSNKSCAKTDRDAISWGRFRRSSKKRPTRIWVQAQTENLQLI